MINIAVSISKKFGARTIFFKAKFAIFHLKLLFETYTATHTMIIKIYNHTKYLHVLIFFDCLSGQGKMEIPVSQGKVREFMISCPSGKPVSAFQIMVM